MVYDYSLHFWFFYNVSCLGNRVILSKFDNQAGNFALLLDGNS